MNHRSVMLREVLECLAPADGEIYIDGTFGAGGYTRAILESADCTVLAIDRDPEAAKHAESFKEQYGARFIFMRGRFGDVESLMREAGFNKVDGFVLDIGVSSMQLDQAQRGFSFRFDAPLDMRMGSDETIPTAADIVNDTDEKELADLIYKYGEERRSRVIAKKIVETRAEKPIETTGALADLVRSVVPKSPGIDPATRTFQALRIAVNDELGELERALESAQRVLKPGGRLVVVSFHSLEDTIVKTFLQSRAEGKAKGSRYMPDAPQKDGMFRLVKRGAIKPGREEENENPRARSARLRAAVRTEVEA